MLGAWAFLQTQEALIIVKMDTEYLRTDREMEKIFPKNNLLIRHTAQVETLSTAHYSYNYRFNTSVLVDLLKAARSAAVAKPVKLLVSE